MALVLNGAPPKQKTADCIVRWDDEWIDVESPSGKRMRIDVTDYENCWDAFSAEETALFDKLTKRGKVSGGRQVLTYREMGVFASAAKRGLVKEEVNKPNPPPPAPSPPPPAPTPPDKPNPEPSKPSNATATANNTVVQTHRGLEIKAARKNGGAVSLPADFFDKKLTLCSMHTIEQRINALERVRQQASEGLSMLIYDIPTMKNEVCPNPSHLLWCYGFRLNLSCWVLPESSINSMDIQELLAHYKLHGIEVHIIPYAREAITQIKEIALDKLCGEITRVHRALVDRLISADEAMKNAEKELDPEATEKERDRVVSAKDSKVRSLLKETAEALARAVKCAEIFDDNGDTKVLLRGLRQALIAEATSFNAAMQAKGSKPCAVK